jgi:hypothetical protein
MVIYGHLELTRLDFDECCAISALVGLFIIIVALSVPRLARSNGEIDFVPTITPKRRAHTFV